MERRVGVPTGKVLGVAGSPATGKRTVGVALAARLGCRHMTVLELAREAGAVLSYDEVDGEYVVDPDMLRQHIGAGLPGGACVLSGVMVPYVLPPSAVQAVIVLRASPGVLYRRYLERGYSEDKISDNLLAEALGVSLSDAISAYGEPLVHEVDTTDRTPDAVVEEVLEVLAGGARPSVRRLDWLLVCLEDDVLRRLCFEGNPPAPGEDRRS